MIFNRVEGKGFLLLIIAGSLILVLSFWIAMAVTGFKARAYPILPENVPLMIGGEEVTALELATRYQPQLYLRPETVTPPPVVMWYEIVDAPEAWVLIYYSEWENEIHPNRQLHYLYSIFRASFYGWPLKDIEYIQINVDKQDGHIRRIRFETTMAQEYDVTISHHFLLFLNCTAAYCDRTISSSNGDVVVLKDRISLPAEGQHRIQLGVATWNHLMVLLDDTNQRLYTEPVNFELRYLDDDIYKRDKYARKSQGDYTTPESWHSRTIAVLVSFGLILTAVTVIRRIL
jgi:hypothetical protein